MTQKIPAYQLIKKAILSNIHAGIWQVGHAIPTEINLAQQFGVARMTVNRALRELTEERVLERRQGAGTFVAQQKFNHTFIEVRNIAKDTAHSNQKYRADVLQKITLHQDTLAQPNHRWLKELFFAQQAITHAIYHVSIVHYADNTPIQYEERWVNATLAPKFIEQDFCQINTSDYLIAHVPLESGDYRILACQPPKPICQSLQMSADEPALLLTRQTFAQDGMVTFVKMWHAGHRYQLCGRL